MSNWSIIVLKSNSSEYELLQVDGRVCEFQTKRNAQLFAESYILEYILKVDGISRLEPFISLPSAVSSMKGLEVTRSDILKINSDTNITNLSRHYILGNTSSQWGLTVHKTHIFMRPVTTTTIIEETKEIEVEEDREVSTKINIIIPGRFFNGREERIVTETVKEKVKKQVPVQRVVETTVEERVVKSRDVFTILLAKGKSHDVLTPLEKENAMIMASDLSREFIETKTAKMLFAVSDSDVPYKVSELLQANSDEFSLYRLPEKTPEKKRSVVSRANEIERKNEVRTELSRVDLRRATNTARVNIGAALAGFGAQVLKRRQEMFPTAIDD